MIHGTNRNQQKRPRPRGFAPLRSRSVSGPWRRSRSLHLPSRSAGSDRSMVGLPWENRYITMGKPWENHGKIVIYMILYERSSMLSSWVNPLFRLGHVQ